MLCLLLSAIFADSHKGGDVYRELRMEIKKLQKRLEGLENCPKKDDCKKKMPCYEAPVPKGYIRIKGLKTALKVSGFVKLDILKHVGSDSTQPNSIATLPLKRWDPNALVRNNLSLFLKETRVAIATKTPMGCTDFNTLVETDFYGATTPGSSTGGLSTAYTSGSTAWGLRLRQAYAEFNGWLFGQTWSNFFDHVAEDTTVSFNGVTGQNLSRRAQIRYTYKNGKNTLVTSLEHPVTEFVHMPIGVLHAEESTIALNTLPDLVMRYLYTDTWGKLGLRGLLRQHKIKNYGQIESFHYNLVNTRGGVNEPFSHEKIGYGIGFEAQLFTSKTNHFFAQMNFGKGIGGYIWDAQGYAALIDYQKRTMRLLEALGAIVAYQHHFHDQLKGHIMAGITWINLPSGIQNDLTYTAKPAGPLNRKIYQVGGNLIYSMFCKRVDVGLEYFYERRDAWFNHFPSHDNTTLRDGISNGKGKLHGNSHRIQLGTWYRF